MTEEFPWLAGVSDKKPSTGPNDTFESLGFSFSEQSSAQPAEHVEGPSAVSGGYADVATTALEPINSRRSTDIVPMSRRALREAERTQPTSRRSLRAADALSTDEPTVAPFPAPVALATSPVAPPSYAAPSGPAPSRPGVPTISLRRRIAKKTFPPAVMLATAALLVGTSVPATALFDPDAPSAATSIATAASANSIIDPELAEGQVVEVEADAELTATVASRDDWSVTSYSELLRLKYGSRDFSYSTTGSGAVRWPFPAAVPISSGFGERLAPCRWCSSYHQGLDFNPGAGTPIFAVADGIVLKAEFSGGFGNHAVIEHIVNGQRVTSTYAHMTRDSSPLTVGQQILAGDFVGTVGSTGASTGAHLHFEIAIDDIPIDPFAWLQANAS